MRKIHIQIFDLVHSKDTFSHAASGSAVILGQGFREPAEILAFNESEGTIVYRYMTTHKDRIEKEIFVASFVFQPIELGSPNEIKILIKYVEIDEIDL